jgi:hypothetical protein
LGQLGQRIECEEFSDDEHVFLLLASSCWACNSISQNDAAALQIVISSTHSLLISNVLLWNNSSTRSGKSISSHGRV